ncbi:isoprenylcysteine carboxylmethyltransferase family protein [Paenarthrobacter sp. GOM3]|uniref:methyltransferase family protein n=1 Tax=Paenarthrobacter sp. GOM3 TaxID=2782567 RepID=UPI0027DDB434|nr:isoprenylcysteine carboxylmethyltransferase family protein [Paenarthrobacter sp. GOM3]WOH18806.1 isoprenylcysteine carboxylmethyltransferase family protein [Paenarthrobacter sp. GOM3]
MTGPAWGRAYFAAQAVAGAAWWISVFALPLIRESTLGQLDPVMVACADIPLFIVASAVAACGSKAAAVIATAWTCLVTLALASYATISTEAGWGVVAMAAASACSIVALCLVAYGRVPSEWVLRGPFAFRPAAQRPTAAPHVATTFVQLALFWSFFLGVIPLAISALENRWAVDLPIPGIAGVIGAVLLVLASALGIYSALAMSTLGQGTPLPSAMPNRLVIAGPYRWIRNPMALAGIVQGAAIGLMLGSWLVVAYAVIGSLVWNYAVRPHEEADLRKRFGTDFDRYCDNVRCWVPRFGN